MSTQANIMKVTPSTAAACVRLSYKIKRPVMLWGPPGIGKSAIVRQCARDMGIAFIDLRLVQIDSVDLRGLPYKDERDEKIVMGFAPSSILPRSGSGILFLDELPQAPTLVQNSVSELLLDRRVGEYELPEGWAVMCAGNRRTDRAGTVEVPSHLKNRLVHIEIKSAYKDWSIWAQKNNINAHIIAFLQSNPKHLEGFDADALAFPTARTWEYVSDILQADAPKSVRDPMIAGCVGEAIGIEVCAYLDTMINLPTYQEVIDNPSGLKIPREANLKYQLIGMVAAEARPRDIDQLIIFLKRMPHEEVKFALITMFENKTDGALFSNDPRLNTLMATLMAESDTPA